MAVLTSVLHNWTLEGFQPIAAWNLFPSATDDEEHQASLGAPPVPELPEPEAHFIDAFFPWSLLRGPSPAPEVNALGNSNHSAREFDSGESKRGHRGVRGPRHSQEHLSSPRRRRWSVWGTTTTSSLSEEIPTTTTTTPELSWFAKRYFQGSFFERLFAEQLAPFMEFWYRLEALCTRISDRVHKYITWTVWTFWFIIAIGSLVLFKLLISHVLIPLVVVMSELYKYLGGSNTWADVDLARVYLSPERNWGKQTK